MKHKVGLLKRKPVSRSVLLMIIMVVLVAENSYSALYESSQDVIQKSQDANLASSEKGSIVPVPIPLSNPTIGTGLQAAVLYMHPTDETSPESPNATSGLAGMYTNNKSWVVGAFHDGSLMNDRIRLNVMGVYGELNLKFYGIGDESFLKDHPISFGFNSFAFSPKILFRLFNKEKWFGGLSYLYLSSRVIFHTDELIPGIGDLEIPRSIAGIGLIGMYDSRDDNYYPTRGKLFEAKYINFADLWGSDSDFNKFKFSFNTYVPASSFITFAWRVKSEMSEGDVPFYALSKLDMHGFSTLRYMDRHTLSFHGEVRYKFHPRWGVVGFAEAGKYASEIEDIFKGKTITSGGAGIRWQVIKDKSMNLGVDFAVSNDDSAVYVQIGEHF